MSLTPHSDHDPNAFLNEGYSEKRALREMYRERDRRAAHRRAMIEKHGPVPHGYEWIEDAEGGASMQPMPKGGRPIAPRSEEQIRTAARVVKEVHWTPAGNADTWATADHAFVIERKFSELTDSWRFIVGPPARDEAGNLLFAVDPERVIAHAASFPKARRVVKMQPVDVDALRGHHTIDPGGARTSPATEQRMRAEIAQGHLTIGD